jgi:uncharacterized protein (DUF1684 family)
MHSGFSFTIALLLLGSGCRTQPPPRSAEGSTDWLEWRSKRHESIAGSNGWTTIVARQWLKPGRNTAGRDPTNQLVLPSEKASAIVGTFFRDGQAVRFEAASGIDATIAGQVVTKTDLVSDASNAPTRLLIGSLTFTIIERGDRIGVRVRDPDAPGRKRFKGLDCYPYDSRWRIAGHFEPYPSVKTLRVDDISGGRQDLASPGTVVFEHDGDQHRLQVVDEPGEKDLFVIFRDQTAGISTYPSGRFLYVPRAGADGKVVIDFNRAYTPPCGFTAFATCPLPPRQNWLPFAVRAGELDPGH